MSLKQYVNIGKDWIHFFGQNTHDCTKNTNYNVALMMTSID